MREKAKYSKTDLKLVEWISRLKPLFQEELRNWLDYMAGMEAELWLTVAIEEDRQPPHPFTVRHRLPSEAVSSACKQRLRYLADHGARTGHTAL